MTYIPARPNGSRRPRPDLRLPRRLRRHALPAVRGSADGRDLRVVRGRGGDLPAAIPEGGSGLRDGRDVLGDQGQRDGAHRRARGLGHGAGHGQ